MLAWRGYRTRDPWREMARWQREMSRFWGDLQARSGHVFPPLNIYDDGESFVVRAEIPGVDPAALEVEATASSVSIKGKRERDARDGKTSTHRRERDHGTFNRTLELPLPVSPDKIMASYRHGILEVVLPKAEEALPRRVAVEG